ncbi:unnamed protein product [Hymenolepis diminuta]|uniref:Ovule protein n=1 Tax=Hymenolepis diminuta TaxID=6216 RepID=A0A0R3SB20_HYMDI|nr:unnamed protein product [Hymenolepis diminuta]
MESTQIHLFSQESLMSHSLQKETGKTLVQLLSRLLIEMMVFFLDLRLFTMIDLMNIQMVKPSFPQELD